MIPSLFSRPRLAAPQFVFALPALLIGLLVVSACSSPESRRFGGRDRPHQPLLVGETKFLGDTLSARVTLGNLSLNSDGTHGDGSGPGGGGGGRRSGGRHHGGGMGPPPGGGELGGEGINVAARGPRLTLRVAFTNHAPQPVEFSVTDVISELGNFAVRPEKLSLQPGETGELDAMNSSYPEIVEELTVEIRLRQNGKTESHSIRIIPQSQPSN